MFKVLIVVSVVLFEVILIIFGSAYLLKKFRKKENLSEKIQVKIQGNTVNSEVIRDGVKAAIQELAYEKEQESLFIKKSKNAEQIYSNIQSNDNPVKHSGGNLVPFNLTDEEKEVMKMFYSND